DTLTHALLFVILCLTPVIYWPVREGVDPLQALIRPKALLSHLGTLTVLVLIWISVRRHGVGGARLTKLSAAGVGVAVALLFVTAATSSAGWSSLHSTLPYLCTIGVFVGVTARPELVPTVQRGIICGCILLALQLVVEEWGRTLPGIVYGSGDFF